MLQTNMPEQYEGRKISILRSDNESATAASLDTIPVYFERRKISKGKSSDNAPEATKSLKRKRGSAPPLGDISTVQAARLLE